MSNEQVTWWDRFEFAVTRMGEGDIGETDAARLGLSLGPTAAQESFARGVAAGLEKAAVVLAQLASDADRAARETPASDISHVKGRHEARCDALGEASRAIRRMRFR